MDAFSRLAAQFVAAYGRQPSPAELRRFANRPLSAR